ncbi:hypothetical protein M7I_2638 [Glarea lozoyensis 74030]|uniref:Uncharacterized protein n=1 Tax=Glarea lozoyensis (strain ATCC 74030 / MF5533) TaxID=1104152 RepID=H0EJB4_GLAL7|nr:hypothetical protein M7I_2638 [Glarea lozoyensis 74030]
MRELPIYFATFLSSLRTTIKAFLRTEEKKREALRQKEVKDTPPATPLEVEPRPLEPTAAAEPTPAAESVANANNEPLPPVETSETERAQDQPPSDGENGAQQDQAEEDVPHQSIEEIAPGQESTQEEGVTNVEDVVEDNQKDGDDGPDGEGKPNAMAGFGFDGSAMGGFPMGFGGDMNPMQQQMMMMMQNGMAPAGFGNFPMMGMPGMNMDPMAMQNMFMNGGFGAAGMGMGGMPMGMGMGGFDGGMGAGFNNGWNGQQSWNNDNFNPNAQGMGQGDYGANNFGNPSHSNGFNQGNGYGRGNQYNDYQNNFGSQGFRGRGRGRGGAYSSRGGHAYGSNDASQQFPYQNGPGQQQNGLLGESSTIPTGPKADVAPNPDGTDEFGREIRSKPEEQDPVADNSVEDATTEVANPSTSLENGAKYDLTGDTEAESIGNDGSIMPIQTFEEAQAANFQTPDSHVYDESYNGGNGFGPTRGGFQHNNHFRGRGGFGAMQPPVKPVDVPINAPKGPKAMREGLPNTSLSNLRGRGFSNIGRPGSSRLEMSASASVLVRKTKKKQKGEENAGANDVARGIKKTAIETGKLGMILAMMTMSYPMTTDQGQRPHPSREDQGIEVDVTRKSTEIGKAIRSINLLRISTDPVDGPIVTIALEAVTGREIANTATVIVDTALRILRPSLISNGANGIEIKGASSRNKIAVEEIKIPTGPRKDRIARHRQEDDSSHRSSRHRDSERSSNRDKDREREREKARGSESSKVVESAQDPHTIEREARNRERLLKEAQRIAGLSGGMARKRSHIEEEEQSSSRSGRKKSRRSGTLHGEDEESRLARMEAERESARWD